MFFTGNTVPTALFAQTLIAIGNGFLFMISTRRLGVQGGNRETGKNMLNDRLHGFLRFFVKYYCAPREANDVTENKSLTKEMHGKEDNTLKTIDANRPVESHIRGRKILPNFRS